MGQSRHQMAMGIIAGNLNQIILSFLDIANSGQQTLLQFLQLPLPLFQAQGGKKS